MAAAPIGPIVLFLGPEEGDKQDAINELRSALRKRHGDELEEHSFYAFETPAHHVTGILQNGSLFGSATFVRYRAVEHLKKKDDVAALLEYAKKPVDSTVLVLESAEIGANRDLEKAVGGRNKKIFWEMFEDQKQGWLQGYFRRHNVQIEPDAVELMLELVQNNTMELRQEADRLIAFVGDHITTDDVDRYIYHAKEENVFTLYDAIVDRDLDHALDIALKLLVTTDPVQILGGLAWQLDRLYALQTLRAAGVPDARLFEELGTFTGRKITSKRAQKSLRVAADRYSLPDCTAIKLLTGDIDALLRSVPTAFHGNLLQQYLYSIIVRNGRWSPQGSESRTRAWEYPATRRRPDLV
ncbi:MAG: DNA polymerase III subunit delta [Spirochaeta sp.]|jgi:DNA polymerase-3 subunit delta|nr:DNA polymerase III subunit delta [Spirochaeta sp.]